MALTTTRVRTLQSQSQQQWQHVVLLAEVGGGLHPRVPRTMQPGSSWPSPACHCRHQHLHQLRRARLLLMWQLTYLHRRCHQYLLQLRQQPPQQPPALTWHHFP